MRYFEDWEHVGARVADAREARGFTQARLSAAIGLDRTAIVKMERGKRAISSLELGRIAVALDLPLEWFIREPPQAVVSRRSEQIHVRSSGALDVELERVARDVQLLLELGSLPKGSPREPSSVRTFSEAEQLSVKVREELGEIGGCIPNLQQAAESLGLYAFAFELPGETADGAYVVLDGGGVAVINGSMPTGRRRFTLAHEIGHHVLSDAYSTDHSLFDDISGNHERLLNAFAIHLLLPRQAVARFWLDHSGGEDARGVAIALAAHFRVSWTATCAHLKNLELIDEHAREVLILQPPVRADYIERGLVFPEELVPPSLPPRYSAAVIRAYRGNRITSTRAVELLRSTLSEEELPPPHEVPLEALRAEFED